MFGYGEKDAPIRRGGVVHDVGVRDNVGWEPQEPGPRFLKPLTAHDPPSGSLGIIAERP